MSTCSNCLYGKELKDDPYGYGVFCRVHKVECFLTSSSCRFFEKKENAQEVASEERFPCKDCLYAEMREGYVDPVYCRVHKRMCKLTNTCEWFNRVENKYVMGDGLPEEYTKRALEWAQKMKKAYEDTMAVSWDMLLAPPPDWYFTFGKKTPKRLTGFVHRRGNETPVGKWTIQLYEPIDKT